MKPISRRTALPAIATALVSPALGHAELNAFEKVPVDDAFPKFSGDLKTLKKMMLFAVRWWTVTYQGRTFHFCRVNSPFVSVSRYDIHAWYQVGEKDERLFHVWSFCTHGIGDISLQLDEVAGTASVMGVDRRMANKKLAFLALSAVDP